jgi:RNA recognition motif-containing protein
MSGQFNGMNNQNPNADQPTDSQSKTLWIGDVEPWMNEQDIAAQFQSITPVTNVKLIRDKVKGTPVGYGFVEFKDWLTAKEVFQTLNGQQVPGSNRIFKLNWASHGGGVASTSRNNTG